MSLLTGMTETGVEVPVQVKPDGRLVAEGLMGPAGADGSEDWTRTGTEISPKTAGDSVFTSGAVKVGGTTAVPNITLAANGGAGFKMPSISATQTIGVGPVDSALGLELKDTATPDSTVSLSNRHILLGPGLNPKTLIEANGLVRFAGNIPTASGGLASSGGGLKVLSDNSEVFVSIDKDNGARVIGFQGATGQATFAGDVKIGGTLPASPNITFTSTGNIHAKGVVSRIYADNTAAKAAGLVAGDIYRTATGQVMIVF